MLPGGSTIASRSVLLLIIFLRPRQAVTDCRCEIRCNDGEKCGPTLDVQIIHAENSGETDPFHNGTLTLKAICTKCAVVNVTSLLYHWSFNAPTDPRSLISVSWSSWDTLTIDLRNVVHENISLTVMDSKCRCIWGQAHYSLNPRRASRLGGCTVTLVDTAFSVTCSDLSHTRLPLTYKFYLVSQQHSDTLLYEGAFPHMPARTLPVGLSGNHFMHTIRIYVTGPAGVETMVDVHIKVRPYSEKVSLDDAAMTQSRAVPSLKEHLAQGDMEGVWKLITRATAAVQDTLHDDTTRQQRYNDLLLEVANFHTTNVEGLGEKAALMERVISLTPDITTHAKATVVDVFGDMTTELLLLSRDILKHGNTSLLDRDIFEHTTCAVMRAVVNTMHHTQKASAGDFTGSQQQRCDISEKIVLLVDRLSSALLNVQPLHASPLLVSTSHLTLRLLKERLEDLASLQLPAMFHGLTGRRSVFQLPRLTSLVAHHSVVGIQLLHWSNSPYSWSEIPAGVGSDVVDLTVLNHAGEPLSLSSLKDPVQFEWSTSDDTADANQLVGRFTVQRAGAAHLLSDDLVSTFSVQVPVGKTYRVHFFCEPTSSQHRPLLIAVRTDSQPEATDFVTDHQSLFKADFHSSFTKTLGSGRDSYNTVRHIVADIGSIAMLGKLPPDAMDRTLYFGFLSDPERVMGNKSDVTHMGLGNETVDKQSVNYDVPYTVTVTATILDCLYWNKRLRTWKNDGCWVSANSNASHVKCECNHLTPFAASSTAAHSSNTTNASNTANATNIANTANASNTTEASSTTESVSYPQKTVLSALLVTWFLYVITLVFAWHKDKEDSIKACLTVLPDNKRCARNPYLVSVMTGWRYNAGTRATVYMYLNGIAGGSVRRVLSDVTRPLFEAGGEDWFLLATRRDLGDLQSLQVWHVGSRSSRPDWFVNQISVYSLRTRHIWHFICDDWIAASGRGEAVKPKTLPADDVNADRDYVFWYRLFVNLVQCSRESHLCLSVLSRQPYNPFTRMQRVTSYMTFLYSAMLSNLLWYHMGASVPIVSYPAIIGIIDVILCSAFVAFITMIFRRVEMPQPKHDPQTMPAPVYGIMLNERMAKIGTTFHSQEEVFYDIADDWADEPDIPYASKLSLNLNADGVYDSKTQLMIGEEIQAAESGDLGKVLLQQRMARLSQAGDHSVTFGGETKEMNRTNIARMLLDRRATVLDPSNSNQNAMPHPHGLLLQKMRTRNMWTDPPKKFPRWLMLIAWFFCLVTIIVATAIVIIFGLWFSDETSTYWMKAVMTTVILDLLLLQPIVVIIQAVVMSYKGPATPVGHPSQFVLFAKPEPTVTFVAGD